MPDEARMSSVADRIADRVIARLTEQSARAQAEADRRKVQSATDRRIEDLRVSLIRAINTALSRAGVELPTSAAATVEPVPPTATGHRGCLCEWDWTQETFPQTHECELHRELRQRAEKAEAERDEAFAEQERLAVENAGYRRQWNGLDVEREKWAALGHENQDLRHRLAEATEWRPIATAPVDTPILMCIETAVLGGLFYVAAGVPRVSCRNAVGVRVQVAYPCEMRRSA